MSLLKHTSSSSDKILKHISSSSEESKNLNDTAVKGKKEASESHIKLVDDSEQENRRDDSYKEEEIVNLVKKECLC